MYYVVNFRSIVGVFIIFCVYINDISAIIHEQSGSVSVLRWETSGSEYSPNVTGVKMSVGLKLLLLALLLASRVSAQGVCDSVGNLSACTNEDHVRVLHLSLLLAVSGKR